MRSMNNNPSGRPYCCFIGCEADAEWGIEAEFNPGDKELDDTMACSAHVGALLGDKAYRVTPVEGYKSLVTIMREAVEMIDSAGRHIMAEHYEDPMVHAFLNTLVAPMREAIAMPRELSDSECEHIKAGVAAIRTD